MWANKCLSFFLFSSFLPSFFLSFLPSSFWKLLWYGFLAPEPKRVLANSWQGQKVKGHEEQRGQRDHEGEAKVIRKQDPQDREKQKPQDIEKAYSQWVVSGKRKKLSCLRYHLLLQRSFLPSHFEVQITFQFRYNVWKVTLLFTIVSVPLLRKKYTSHWCQTWPCDLLWSIKCEGKL